ncbi:MAG: HIT family protein [Galactobacillus timonensis]|uniref:HIT family protein n=1 Tax=Galactobacillus timonensis TaxID=2041840 RepID=UPI0023F1E40E|nr:HIT family protein [Galactobacillus timonensis]MCI6068531.1 HIT family protein [Galactobacillus timonensis]MCI6754866.1 HIT family protein [Galactobacillus timonensis]
MEEIKDPNCSYCAKGDLVNAFAYEICELPASTVYVFREQTHPGRCVVASKHHVSEIVDLPLEEQQAFLADVVRVARAIHEAYHPDKLNYGMFGDTGHHLHCHLVPKYKDQAEWGGTFLMNPTPNKISDEEARVIADRLRPLILNQK